MPAPDSIRQPSRRDLLRQAAFVGAGTLLAPLAGCGTPRFTPARRDAIRAENSLPGTRDWLLAKTRTAPEAPCRCPWVEGYCSRTSVRAGETLEFVVSTRPAAIVTLDLYRLGYYGGAGGRFLRRLGPFECVPQPEPPVGPERVRACRWTPTARLTVPADWLSGVYLGTLTEQREGVQSYVIFIVRDDRACDFLFQCSDTTWAAYNRWPDYWSLYDDDTPGRPWYVGPGVGVSFDRPYGKYRQILNAPLSQGSGEYLLWEFPLAYWMEREGYDVSYLSNVDTHAEAASLLRARAWLSVGHDEYWTPPMYENVRAAIAAGVSAAFFSGNSCDGVIDLRASAAGGRNRELFRVGKFGASGRSVERYAGRWTRHGPDPALLMGAATTDPYNGGADWTCVNERHWIFSGTGLQHGDSIPGLVGWEHHGNPAALPGLEVLARGPVFINSRPQGVDYTATIYPGPRGNLVFNAATIWWPAGLAAPPGYLRPKVHGYSPPPPDSRVQRITANLFARFLAAPRSGD
jgi:hypothetical protein